MSKTKIQSKKFQRTDLLSILNEIKDLDQKLSCDEKLKVYVNDKKAVFNEAELKHIGNLLWNEGGSLERDVNANAFIVFRIRKLAISCWLLEGSNINETLRRCCGTILKYCRSQDKKESQEIKSLLQNTFEQLHTDKSFIETCTDTIFLSICIFHCGETIELTSYKPLLKKLLKNAESESPILLQTYSFFYTFFVDMFSSTDLYTKNCFKVVSHFEFCTTMTELYLQAASANNRLSYFDDRKTVTMCYIFLKCLASMIQKKLLNEENGQKVCQKFVNLSVRSLKDCNITQDILPIYMRYISSIKDIGTGLYSDKKYSSSCFYFKTSCDLYTKNSHLIQADMEDLIWCQTKNLTRALSNSGKCSEALQTIIQYAISRRKNWQECFELWQTVKKTANSSKDETTVRKTVSDIISDWKLSVSCEDEIALLKLELRSCKADSDSNVDETYTTAIRLLSMPLSDVEKAKVTLETLSISAMVAEKVSGLSRKMAIEVCSECINSYEEHITTTADDCKAKLELSVAYFLQYHLKMKKLHEVASKETEVCLAAMSYPDKSDNNENDLDDDSDLSPAFPLLNTKIEAEVLKSLERALELWNGIPEIAWKDLSSDVEDWGLFDIVKCTGELFATSAKELEELKTLKFLYKISSTFSKKHHEVSALILLINFTVKTGYFISAGELIQRVRDSFSGDLTDQELLRLQLAECCYKLHHLRKFDEGLDLLRTIWTSEILQGKTKIPFMLRAEVCLLQAAYLLIPRTAFRNPENTAFLRGRMSISSLLESASLSRKVLATLAENPESGECMSLRPTLLRNILITYLELSQLCFNVGEIRLSRCYLKEGLKIAASNVLTYWSSRFLVLLGHIDLFCDELKECHTKINGLKYIMNGAGSTEMLLSKVFLQVPGDKLSPLAERNSPSSFQIAEPKKGIAHTKRAMKQNFLPTELYCSPRKKSLQIDLEVDLTNYRQNVLRLEIRRLRCEYLAAEGKREVAAEEMKKDFGGKSVEKWYKNLIATENILKELKGLDILFKDPTKCSTAAEITFTAAFLLKLSNLENSASYRNEAFRLLSKSAVCPRNAYPEIHAALVYEKTLQEIRKMTDQSPGTCLLSAICPHVKPCSSIAKKPKLKLPVLNTPTKEVRTSGLPTVSKKNLCNAPFKKELLPSHLQSDSKMVIIFSSSDEEEDKAPKKAASRVKKKVAAKEPQRSYKMFTSKNPTIKIETSSDIWKTAAMCTPPSQKKQLFKQKNRLSPPRVVTNTRSKSTTSANKPKSNRCKNVAFYSDETDSKVTHPKMSSKGDSADESRECPRSSSIECSDVFTSALNDLCDDIGAMDIGQKEFAIDGPWTKIADDDIEHCIRELSEIRALISHTTPYPTYVNVCKLLAILKMIQRKKSSAESDRSANMEIGFLVSETASVTLRQVYQSYRLYYLANVAKNTEDSLTTNCLVDQESSISERMEELLKTLPKEYTVVQMSVVSGQAATSNPKKNNPTKLVVSRYQNGSQPVVLVLETETMHLLTQFESILTDLKMIVKNSDDPKKWWHARSVLDRQLQSLVSSLEDSFFGSWKGLLLSQIESRQRKKQLGDLCDKVCSIAPVQDPNLVRVFLDSISFLTSAQISHGVSQLWRCAPADPLHGQLTEVIKHESRKMSGTNRGSLVLILDSILCVLPWENLPILRNISVTRMPSLSLLGVKLAERACPPPPVDCNNTIYILNPDADLQYTEQYFLDKFESQSWSGITGRKPTIIEYTEAFTNYELLVYCGHGSSQKFLGRTTLERLRCKSAALLFGCSSGKLRRYGKHMEAYGFPLMLLMSGSPSILGNLWDVTDKDIDRFADKLLQAFIPSYDTDAATPARSTTDLAKAVSQARNACKMPYLVGAAPVVYGFPISACRESKS